MEGGFEMKTLQFIKNLNYLDEKQISEIDEAQNIKYQEIFYHKHTPKKTIYSKEEQPVDFLKAMNEMEDLVYGQGWYYIQFHNKRNGDEVGFVRKKEDEWYVQTSIKSSSNDYFWCVHTSSENVSSLLRLFFEEMPWFGLLQWKMNRCREDGSFEC